MHNINTHILCVTIVVCTYRSVAMVACCCTGTITRIPRRVIRSRRWIVGIQEVTCKFSTMMVNMINSTWCLNTHDQCRHNGQEKRKNIMYGGGGGRFPIQDTNKRLLILATTSQCGQVLIMDKLRKFMVFFT